MAKLGLSSCAKFRRLCARLQLESAAFARGLLDELWSNSHQAKSPIVGDLDDIEALCLWPTTRTRGELAAALIELGFLDEIVPGRVYAIHDWFEHSPEFCRKAVARRAAQDVTVGPETYFLGIDAFRRLFEDPDATVPGEVVEGELIAPATGGRTAADSGCLSSHAKASLTSPPVVPLGAGAQRRPGGRRGARRRPVALEGLATPAARELSAEEAFARMKVETVKDAATFGASREDLKRLEQAVDAAELGALFESAIRPRQPAAEAKAAP